MIVVAQSSASKALRAFLDDHYTTMQIAVEIVSIADERFVACGWIET